MSGSSSEDENTARLKEAVWSFGPKDVKINGEGGDNNSKKSHRADVSKHEHDGNELGTTPEFRSHVAKKLGALLDGSISEVFSQTVESGWSENRNEEQDDEGFRLFSTSAPGNWKEQSPPPPPKRRPVPSSSDSDSEMEMRFREAAVSLSDILGPSAQHLTDEKTTTKAESQTREKDSVKKKRKRKTFIGESEEKNSVSEKRSNGEGPEEQTTKENLTKKKKKKKKKKKRKKLEEGTKDNDE